MENINLEVMPGSLQILTGNNGTGKTRILSNISSKEKARIKNGSSKYNRLICLSGTVFEKYPKPDKDLTKNIKDGYYYFGYKPKNNMFSEIAPFRVFISLLLNNPHGNSKAEIAANLMKEIGFEPKIKLDFRWARNNKEKNIEFDTGVRELDINNFHSSIQELFSIKKPLNEEIIHLSKIYFYKDGGDFQISDLSSGERVFLLTILSLCFSIDEHSLILFDEPENSMHPSWQEKITKIACLIFEQYRDTSSFIIATHSPLVVSSIPNNGNKIINLSEEYGDWEDQSLSGNNSDSILKEHFNLISARSSEFTEAIQLCLKSLLTDSGSFIEERERLISMNVNLNKDDPLFDAYETIMNHEAN
ncbi:AAA family ATPase [Photobacterium atrarenae]|uniref:ATP-binding protein n=1 Tax=Photobacterium atrarenae TaxID=865757 RepID=A0ABY5GDD6_9GAMM|nr:AAA family ATPase [Photobacterium atrarenae]UTV27211.1 ATP-binding protein [Photobacterium atrarenae]